ncbi:hypothetical protein DM02DRAFT_656853 [Periconia macrospinosa]|uniref:Uncharacterized protein n=1 Tax=Periconia macrospinosa TaxID=97972 RepID=A0A2V1DLI2_9PLEO|nr:hypothetical protein DM02DRAFT_656853 [Periconia macrospinosa]
MVRFTYMLHLSLLAVVAVASPRLQGQHDVKCAKNDDCSKEFCIDGTSSTCLESKTCGCSTLVVRCGEGEKISCHRNTTAEGEEKGSCTCQKPVGTEQRKKYNQQQRKFLDKAKKKGVNWAASEFPKEYPEEYERWHWQNSSRTHQTPSEADRKIKEASLLRLELMKSAPEVYSNSSLSNFTSGSPKSNVTSDTLKNTGTTGGLQENGTSGGHWSNSTSGGHWSNSTSGRHWSNSTSGGHWSNSASGTGMVQVPGTDKWVHGNVTAQRLEELALIVPKVEEADNHLSKLREEDKKVDEEFHTWVGKWLKQEQAELKESEEKIKKAEEEAKEKEKDEKLRKSVCGDKDNSVIFKTTDQARKHMDNGRYVLEADRFIARLSKDEMATGGTKRGAQPWPEQYVIEYNWTQTNTVRDQNFDDCRRLGRSCDLFTPSNGQYDCAWFWNRSDIYNAKVGYWVLRVIEGVNHKLTFFSERLTEVILKKSLKLDQINEDFDPSPPKEDPAWKWFKFAFGMATEFIPGPKVVGEGNDEKLQRAAELFQVVVDTFDTISEEVKNAKGTASPITSADLKVALGDIFETMSDSLQNSLWRALGRSQEVKDWDKLPAFGNTKNFKTPVGKFLNNPIWLLENDADVLDKAMAAAARNIEYKMIDMKLRSENWYLTEDTRTTNKCDRKGARKMKYAGKKKCFQLYKFSGWHTVKDKPEPADDKFYDKMAKYGLEDEALTKYYRAILDCYQKKGKNGELDTNKAVIPGGSMPTCFFALRAAKIKVGSGCDQGAHGRMFNCETWRDEELEK